MPSNSLTFISSSFTGSTPTYNPGGEYDNNLQFTTITKTLKLPSTNHKIHSFTISNHTTDDYDYGAIAFSTPNRSNIGVKNTNEQLYVPQLEGNIVELAFKEDGDFYNDNTNVLVVTNGDDNNKTEYLNVHITLAHKKKIPSSNSTITLTHTCESSTVHSYTVGMHAYSPYDARSGSSTLTTKVYSETAIGSWTTNSGGTLVYSSPYLNNPALPYWYGYGSNVYRIGAEWDRAYGTKRYLEVRKKRFKKPKSKMYVQGPMDTYDSVNETSEACIEVVYKDIGKVRKIEANSNLTQPQQYRYYLGYNSSNKRTSNDSVFKAISYNKKKSYPITGAQHAFNKIPKGLADAFFQGIIVNLVPLALIGAMGLGIQALGGWAVVTKTGASISMFFGELIGGLLPQWLTVSSSSGLATFISAAVPYIILIAAIIFLFLQIFRKYTRKYQEECPLFLHHFTNSPYLNTGDTLYRDEDLSVINNGWYCDGAYFYYQSGGSITSKSLSRTYAFIDDDPFTQRWEYSIKPDVPTLVVDWPKLIFVAYVSGKPTPYCGGDTIYYSQEFSETLTADCCEMQNGASELVYLPPSASTSCTSLSAANAEAEQLFSASLEKVRAEIGINYGTSIDDSLIGEFDADFTHEIRIEDNPTQVGLFYDLRSGSLGVGTPLYYDPTGCQKVLNGWYATSSASNFRSIYRVEGGYITAADTITVSGSLATSNSRGIDYTNLDYSSNWYLKSIIRSNLNIYANRKLTLSDYELNTLYSSSNYTLVAGYHQTASLDDFQEYASYSSTGIVNTGSSMIEAEADWYLPLNDFLDTDDMFLYQDTLIAFTSSTRGNVASDVCPFTVAHLSQSYYHNGEAGDLPQVGDRVYLNTGSAIASNRLKDGYYMVASSSIMQVDDGLVIERRLCTSEESESGADVDPALLRYNAAGSSTSCTSSLQTVYISGSFTGQLHGIWSNSAGTIRAATGSYSNGSVYRIYAQGIGDDYLISNTQSCSGGSGNTVLSSSMLYYDDNSENEACAGTGSPLTRYWWTGGSDWYNSSTLYRTTASSGNGQNEAMEGWYSDGLTVNEYTNSSWENAGICSGGGIP